MYDAMTNFLPILAFTIIPWFQFRNRVNILSSKFGMSKLLPLLALVALGANIARFHDLISIDQLIYLTSPLLQFIWAVSCYRLFVKLTGEQPIYVFYKSKSGLAKHRLYAFVTLTFSIYLPMALLLMVDLGT